MKTLEVLEKVLKGKRLRPATRRHYIDALGSLARYSEMWPKSGAVINEWLTSLTGFADTTIKMWFSVVNSAGRYMKKAHKIGNPCERAERPKVIRKMRRYFSPEEIVGIIKACKDDYELLLVLTLVDSACRIGELVSLTGGNVGDGFISVKGKTGQRRYRLDARICERLRVFAGGEDKPVFKQKWTGGFYPDGNALAHRVRYIVVRAGIKGSKSGVHTLRHSSASLVAMEGGQGLIVKALLQHDDIKTSMDYIHDVDDLVVRDDKYSPLRLLGKRYAERVSGGRVPALMQIEDGQGGKSIAIVPVRDDGLVEVEGASLLGDSFPDVEDGIAVRTVLRSEDLILIREAFVFYARYNDGNHTARARALMRRMLRKGGSERYARKK